MQEMQKKVKSRGELAHELEQETKTKRAYEGVIVAEAVIIAVVFLIAFLLFIRLNEQESHYESAALAAEAGASTDATAANGAASAASATDAATLASSSAAERKFSTPVHLTLSAPDFLINREGRIGYANLEEELEAYGATNLVFDRSNTKDEDGANLEVGTMTGVFPGVKGDTKFEVRTELDPPEAGEHDYSLTTIIVFKDKDDRCFTATRERMAMFEEFAEESENKDSGLFPTVLFYDETKGIMLTEEQVNALKWVAMNYLPSEDEVDAPKTTSQITNPVVAINLPAVSDYLVKHNKIKS